MRRYLIGYNIYAGNRHQGNGSLVYDMSAPTTIAEVLQLSNGLTAELSNRGTLRAGQRVEVIAWSEMGER